MKIIFCRVAYMKKYSGDRDDIPQNTGKYISKDFYAKERYNFLNGEGSCYGYFQGYGNQINIERIETVTPEDNKAEDVLVVWTAKKNGKYVIIGWYKKATVYRYYKKISMFPIEIKWDYCVSAKTEDCYLLPEDKRQFEIPQASAAGVGKGMGQSSIWYAESDYAREIFIPQVMEYIKSCEDDGEFISLAYSSEQLGEYFNPDKWVDYAKESKENAEEALKHIEAAVNCKPSGKLLMAEGDILMMLSDKAKAECCYEEAFKMDIMLDGICKKLLDLYIETEQYEKLITFADFIERSELYAYHTGLDKVILGLWKAYAHISINDNQTVESVKKVLEMDWGGIKGLEQNMKYLD